MKTTAPAIEQLRATVEDMDYQSQTAFTKINALASLISCALSHPEKAPIEAIQNALEQIRYICDDTENEINVDAGNVGCCHSQ
jgi:tetrahydromethanopterin S-methyltransferase subunit F